MAWTDTAGVNGLLQGDDRWREVTRVFDRLVDLAPDRQEAELARLDADTAELVRRLLRAAATDGLLDRAPALGSARADAAPAAPAPGWLEEGARVGPYRVERPLGRGGMGEVYVAQRIEGFRQHVAIKLLRLDAGPAMLAFAREREMLARMEHPGIARLIDGGVREDGRPWMAMEYVEGVPIDRWCTANGSTLDQRLGLFRQLCDAVAFAHANLVVHCDIKPGNVLVDKTGRVRLLDFGIAKLAGDIDAAANTTMALLTPQYAAPEQFDRDRVTVATDIHALGVLLYELLAGNGPWSGSGSLGVIVRRVIDEEPQAPSRAAQDGTSPVAPARLRGDLDAVVLKATRKRPADRYASVAELAEDIDRYRAVKPLRARAGSRRYVASRYLRRNRWPLAAAGAIAAALLGGTVAVADQARKAAAERDVALAQAERLDAITQTLTLMFARGGDDGDSNPSAREMLDAASARLLGSLDRSARSGAAAVALTDVYITIQSPQDAANLARGALSRGIGEDDPLSVARLRVRLANVIINIGGPEDPAQLLAEAGAGFAKAPGTTAYDRLDLVRNRASLARRERDYDKAMALLMGIMDLVDRTYASDRAEQLTFYNNALVYAMEGGRLDLARRIFPRAEAWAATPSGRDTLQALGIAGLRGIETMREGHPAEAAGILSEVAARRQRLFGRSAGLANDLTQLARAELMLGHPDRALAALDKARPIALAEMGPAAPPTLTLEMARAEALAGLGRAAEGEAALAEIDKAIAAIPSPSLPHALYEQAQAVVFIGQGRKEEAARALARAHMIYDALGPAGAAALRPLEAIERQFAALG